MIQLRDLAPHVGLEHGRVAPLGPPERRGHDVLGHAVQPVRPLAEAGQTAPGEPVVAAPAQQQGLGAQRLVEPHLRPRFAVLVPNLEKPATAPEALLTGRMLDDSIERDVLADDDLPHVVLLWFGVASCTAAGPPVAPSAGVRIVRTVGVADTATPGKWAPANRPVRALAGVYTRVKVRQSAGRRW